MSDTGIVTQHQLAKLLDVHERTVARWRKLPDPLPGYRPDGGRRVYFIMADVIDWLRRQPAEFGTHAPETTEGIHQ